MQQAHDQKADFVVPSFESEATPHFTVSWSNMWAKVGGENIAELAKRLHFPPESVEPSFKKKKEAQETNKGSAKNHAKKNFVEPTVPLEASPLQAIKPSAETSKSLAASMGPTDLTGQAADRSLGRFKPWIGYKNHA
ncbi:hypothetical protein CCACVL1_19146 [Corchorus capsularis]|uniref:Uncharacterized protein n=1 Tax=Corchorus capsularis TaxID=210143 RepID=A0A1R3HI34_COCAP|nr:hypothetical protein CCACVL1_19146 [Corchorus capsularis]